MICFEIFVNGKRICLAGVEFGVLAAHLTSWQGTLEEGSTTERESQLHLFVSGTTDGKHFRWPEPNLTPLAVGDEVTFRVVEADTPDEAVRHYRQANGEYRSTAQPDVAEES